MVFVKLFQDFDLVERSAYILASSLALDGSVNFLSAAGTIFLFIAHFYTFFLYFNFFLAFYFWALLCYVWII